uniref:C2H2-type domain-containing protein n=1 Tax=Heterorhabditis bacteriophora TaxID=37862 RepID=A0A1I7X8E7_HETBA
MHSISRMFMCRCCNWAFPDKTSLHIHMQSMLRNGTPGDVAVLARSSTEVKTYIYIYIYIYMVYQEGVMHGIDLSAISSNQWLASWLANNPFAPSLGMTGLQSPMIAPHSSRILNKNTQSPHDEVLPTDEDYDALEIKTTEKDLHEDEIEEPHTPQSVIVKTDQEDPVRKTEETRGSQKRKATRPQQVTDCVNIDVEGNQGQPPIKVPFEEKETTEQPSPTVSDSHISGSSSHSGDSPHKCFDCQVVKGKLNATESKVHEYEQKINFLESKIAELQRNTSGDPKLRISDNDGKEKKSEEPVAPVTQTSAPQLPLFPPLAPPLSLIHNPAMKIFLHNFMQAQLNRQSC